MNGFNSWIYKKFIYILGDFVFKIFLGIIFFSLLVSLSLYLTPPKKQNKTNAEQKTGIKCHEPSHFSFS